MSVAKKSILIILLVLIVDQASKIYIKLNFALWDSIHVFDWFQIFFIENNGMAFGIEFGGKLFLTFFRIVAVAALIYYVCQLIKRKERPGYIFTISLLLAGAAGNIFDSVFYGVLFSESTPLQLAQFMPPEGGYASLFHGKVVDMLYFPIIKDSVGKTLFFSPVFNIADSAITCSVFILLLFFRKELNAGFDGKGKAKKEEESPSE